MTHQKSFEIRKREKVFFSPWCSSQWSTRILLHIQWKISKIHLFCQKWCAYHITSTTYEPFCCAAQCSIISIVYSKNFKWDTLQKKLKCIHETVKLDSFLAWQTRIIVRIIYEQNLAKRSVKSMPSFSNYRRICTRRRSSKQNVRDAVILCFYFVCSFIRIHVRIRNISKRNGYEWMREKMYTFWTSKLRMIVDVISKRIRKLFCVEVILQYPLINIINAPFFVIYMLRTSESLYMSGTHRHFWEYNCFQAFFILIHFEYLGSPHHFQYSQCHSQVKIYSYDIKMRRSETYN